MKSNVWTIMKKEFARFFGDRRMLMTIILPGVLIYVMYSFMGTALSSMFHPDEEYLPAVFVFNMPDSLKGEPMGYWAWARLLETGTSEIPDADAAKQRVSDKQADLCVVFPVGFDALAEEYDVKTSTTAAPNIEVYFNSTEINSQMAFSTLLSLLDAYETSLTNMFDVNRDVGAADLASDEDTSATMISSLMPMLLMLFLYTGCISIAPESIAGEKERGTIGAMLVSPLKRSEFAIGKILSLGVLAFLAGLISAVATILSLPKLMGLGGSLEVDIYGATDYFFLAIIILSTILLLISLISIISAFSKTVKEASAAVMPLMIIVMLIGVTGMFSGGAKADWIYYLIPVYNSVQSMSGVFSLDYSAINVVISGASNLIYACAGGFILTKMFNSEKIMFSR